MNRLTLTATLLALLLAACAAPTGSLTVLVAGLPVGVGADVRITGPASFDRAVTTSTVLTELAPGTYRATANGVGDGSNQYSVTVAGSPADVSGSAAAQIDVTYALVPGTLLLTITGLPSRVDADVLVEGANGFSQLLTESADLTGLPPGIYTLTASPTLRASDPIVSSLYAVASALPATVEISSGATAVVGTSYALVPSSGRLWTPHFGAEVATGFAASDLAVSGSPTPAATITGAFDVREAIAFDAAGNAWISNQPLNIVERYAASDLAGDGSPSPTVVLGGLAGPFGLAFDGSGNLWVANNGSNTLAMFTPAQQAVSGSPTPSVTLSANGSSIDGPSGLAFDASGNLWLGNFIVDSVVRFGASQLTASGSPVPELTMIGGGGNLDLPTGLAFDASGDLWVSNLSGPDAVLKFEDPGALSGTAIVIPAVILTSVDDPAGIAFDETGALWVASSTSGDLARFESPELMEGAVSPPAEVAISGATDIDLGLFAFFPPATGLPIATP